MKHTQTHTPKKNHSLLTTTPATFVINLFLCINFVNDKSRKTFKKIEYKYKIDLEFKLIIKLRRYADEIDRPDDGVI